MTTFKGRSLGGLLGFILLSQSLWAQWAAVSLYRNLSHDHIEVNFHDPKTNQSLRANVWGSFYGEFNAKELVMNGDDFFVFPISKSIPQIKKEWDQFQFSNNPSFFSNNCATATYHIVESILNIKVPRKRFWGRTLFFMYTPTLFKTHGPDIPQVAFKRIKAALNKQKIAFKSKKEILNGKMWYLHE